MSALCQERSRGHRRNRIYSRLDCPAALRAIARGGYVIHRVFFSEEEDAGSWLPTLRRLPPRCLHGLEDASLMAYRRPGQFVILAGKYQPEGDTLRIMDKQQLLKRLETAWTALKESYTGLSDAQLLEPGVMGDWSVKEILAHLTIWEEEALKYLPLLSNGEKPPRYVRYGGIDAFNAQMI